MALNSRCQATPDVAGAHTSVRLAMVPCHCHHVVQKMSFWWCGRVVRRLSAKAAANVQSAILRSEGSAFG